MPDFAPVAPDIIRATYPLLRARLWMALPFTPGGGLISPFAAASSGAIPFIAPIGRDVIPQRMDCGVDALATNNGSNYWTIALSILTPAGAATSQGSVNTSALTAGQWNTISLTSFTTALWDAATYSIAFLTIVKTGNPGNLYLSPVLWVT